MRPGTLVAEGVRGIALLFVVGEERNSAGAYAAAKQNRGSRFLINGEPTENKLALGSKGALRYEITAQGPHGALRLSAAWANPPSRNCWMRWNESAGSSSLR